MPEVGNLNVKVSMDQTGFQQGISALNRQLRIVQSEFKASSAQLGDFGKSTEGLKLKADSLTKQIEVQKQRVQALDDAYKKSVETKGVDAKATQNLEVRLNNAKAQLSGMENELKKTNQELGEQGFQQKMAGLNRQLELAQSEFKAATAQLGDFGKGTEGLKLKSDSLTKQLEIQRQKVKTLDEAHQKSAEAKGADAQETQELQIQLNKAKTEMAQIENELKKTTAEIERQTSRWGNLAARIQDTGDRLKVAGGKMADVGKTLSAKVTAPIAAAFSAFSAGLIKAGIDRNSFKEDTITALSTMMGSAEKAKKFVDDLAAFARQTPFAFPDLATSGRNMIAFGMESKKVIPTLTAIGDAVAGIGGGRAELESISDAFGKIQAAGRLSMQEINSLSRNGIPALQILANQAGITAEAMRDKISKGAIDANTAIFWLVKGIEEGTTGLAGTTAAFGGMMEKNQGTWRGALDKMRGAWSRAGEEIMEKHMPLLVESVQKLTEAIKKIPETIGPVVDIVAGIFSKLISIIAGIINKFSELKPAVQHVILVITGLIIALGPLLLIIGSLITFVGVMITAFSGFAATIGAAGGMVGVFSGALAALTSPVALIIAGITALIAAVMVLYQNWETIWGAITSATSTAAENISSVVSRMGDVLGDVWESIGTGVTVAAASIGGLLLPQFIALAAQATITAAKVVASWVSMAAGAMASATVQAIQVIPSLLKQFVALAVGAAQAAVRVVASWVTMAVQATINAVRMAAAWVVAMGPVGWVGAAIAGLAALIASKTGWMAKAVEAAKDKIIRAFQAIVDAFDKLKTKLGREGGKKEKVTLSTKKAENDINKEIQNMLKDFQLGIDATPNFDGIGKAASGAGGKMKEAAEKAKTAWVGTAEALKSALSIMQSQHETEMIRAEMAGDKVAVLRLKYQQLNIELEKQKQVVAATRAEVDRTIAAGVLEGETKEDLAKRIDELNKKLVDEEKAQAQLEKQICDTSETIKAQGKSAKDLTAELKKVWETYNTDMAKALEDYRKKVKDTNESLKKDVDSLQRDLNKKLDDIRAKGADRERQVTEQFQRELDNRTRALTNFVGLFDEVTQKAVSGDTLLRNLEGQVSAFDSWQENIQALAARGIDEGLLQELREMGPKAGPEIAALNTLTDEQLSRYVILWKQKQEQAKKEATEQLAQQRQEMNSQLSAIRQDTQNQLEQQRMEMAQKLQEMQAKAKEELEKYKQEWEKKNEEIRKNTEKNIKGIHDKFNDLVGKSSGYGVSLMENFMDGIDKMMPSLIAQLESIAETIDSYMPHSPAKRGPLKRLNEWGPALVGTFAEGIKRSLPTLENVTARMAMLSPGALQPAVANSYSTSNVNYNQGGNTINITVQDGEDLLRTLHRLGVSF